MEHLPRAGQALPDGAKPPPKEPLRFYLKWYGDILPSARAACPHTVALVESIEGVNAAAFTLLPAVKKLGRHRDPFAGSLRYHLGLVTPNSEACRIWVDGEVHTWRDGEDVVFDETYIHWAESTSDVDRIILFCDVRRPLRTPLLRAFARFMDRRVFRVTGSRNSPSERVGALDRLTPVVYRTKTALTEAKNRNRVAYYATKHVLIAGLAYLLARSGSRADLQPRTSMSHLHFLHTFFSHRRHELLGRRLRARSAARRDRAA